MQKIMVEEITAYNGTPVICTRDANYHHTEFDDIIFAWKEQERKYKKNKKAKKNLFKILKGVIA